MYNAFVFLTDSMISREPFCCNYRCIRLILFLNLLYKYAQSKLIYVETTDELAETLNYAFFAER